VRQGAATNTRANATSIVRVGVCPTSTSVDSSGTGRRSARDANRVWSSASTVSGLINIIHKFRRVLIPMVPNSLHVQ
jgi:hypothetical protein